tara:strand:+ start:1312 stop:2547 length:1236 start_codon:yes stop_codon:yes gene_type:complete
MAGMHRRHITSQMAQPRRARDDARLKVSASEPTFRYRTNLIGSSRWPNPDASGFRKRVASEEQDVTRWVPGGYREHNGAVPMTLHIERSQGTSGKAAPARGTTKREPAISASASQPSRRTVGDAGRSSRNMRADGVASRTSVAAPASSKDASSSGQPAPNACSSKADTAQRRRGGIRAATKSAGLGIEAEMAFGRAGRGRRRRERDGTDTQLTLKALFPLRPKWLSEAEEQKIRERFNQYDDDHDGLLSINELRMALKALDKYVNEIQLKELMEAMDENDSGTIELRELLDYMQRCPQPNMNTGRAVAEQEASDLFATMASKNRGIQPRGREHITGVQERVGVVDVRCDTPDEAAKIDLRAIDEFLRSEFDLEGFAEMQKEMIASGAGSDGGVNDGQVKLKDFNRVLAQEF